jgi:O-antigen/teichoic acid export membrane protein
MELATRLAQRILGPGFRLSFFEAVGSVAVLRLSGGVLLFSSQILLAGWMGPEAFGAYSFAWAWIAVLSTVAGLGFNTTSVRFIPRYLAAARTAKARGLVRFGRILTLLVSCALAVLSISGIWLFVSDTPYRGPLIISCLAIPFLAFMHLEAGYARAFNWMATSTIAEQIARPTLLMAMGFVMVLTFDHASAEVFAALCALAYFIATAGQHAVVRGRIRRVLKVGETKLDARVWMGVSFAMLLMTGSQTIRMNSDLILVGLYLDPATVEIYTAAVRVATLVSFVFVVTNIVAQPTIASLYSLGRHLDLQHFVTTASRWMFLASLATASVILLFGTFFLGLFGPDFTAGYDALTILVIGHVLVSAFGPVTSLLAMTEHHRSAALAHGVSVLTGVVLNVVLIPFFGIAGAAVATSLNLVLTHAVLFYLVQRELGLCPSVVSFAAARREI